MIILPVGGINVDAKRIGHRIQAARKARGMTQAELARATNLSVKYVSNIECGNKVPTLDTFIVIANALQSDANTLFADVLDVSAIQESGDISARLAELKPTVQRKLLRVLDTMIDEIKTL